MKLIRKMVHELYPEVMERVSYAMPGFYPKEAKKSTQQLFLLMACQKWLGIYGTQVYEEESFKVFQRFGIKSEKGSLQVPYDMDESIFKDLLQIVIEHNLKRHGFSRSY
ncbi:uncharacterized protein YdhG (YjbR/CyaY superfamily) [Lactovum miscens]|uniref:Uncharacterized protein YdhG (YjbR/CyaY superfamily) n=2 Tax=Lactovum miscens TaxID=190387 RepID=A0A841C8Q1_9LACT|nr:uncharacterized protein YdhG (YjbR/CyaY superfamily) [Lactovum miscens]